MSTIKKLLALVLALTMVLSVSAAAGYTVAPYGDAAGIDANAEEAVQLLYSLNIMKGDNKGNFNPEATITRAEVAKMIYVVLNYGEDDLAKNYTGAKFFSDVETGAWYEGYVNYAASIKLVQGRPDGTFGPNDPVTCAEAAKMLLTAIGYSAEARGYVGANWDKQVLSDASIIGLLEGYDYNTQTYAPRQWVAVMFMNALTEALTYDTIIPTTFNSLLTGNNYGTYTTMGWKYFELYDWAGIIVANEYADLYADEPLSSERTQIRYENDDEEYEYITFKNWSTGLTEIGEYARGWATGSKVLYVTDDGMNTEFMTGEATDISSNSKFKGVTGLKNGGENFVNFDKASVSGTDAGEWLRVVSNDGDSTADYVFKTEFTMTTYTKIDSDDNLVLKGKTVKDGEYVLAEDAVKGDVVIYTTIDGITYVEVAPSFDGEAEKYTYKTDALTVDGETYIQSGIDYNKDVEMWAFVKDADKDIEYTYYQDFFGNIRLFAVDVADAGDLVLLTDAYYEENRSGYVYAVDAYLDGEIGDYDVVKPSTSNHVGYFIDDSAVSLNNSWNRLEGFEDEDGEAQTHVARYSVTDDGALVLKKATTYRYNTMGEYVKDNEIKSDYIDLDNDQEIKAGQKTYVAADGTTKVQANKDTVYYYVSYAKGYPVVKSVVGYKNSFDVRHTLVGTEAIYAVATDISDDAAGKDYWVADVIVVETNLPVFTLLTDDVVLGYDVEYRAVKDYAYLNVLKTDATTDGLTVISHNGDDFDSFAKGEDLKVLNYFYNTVDENGDSYLVGFEYADYAENKIYVGTADRVADLYDYIVAIGDGKEYEVTEDTVVYDIDAKTGYNKISTVDGLETGETYIFYAPKGEIVYAVLVEDALTELLADTIVGKPGLNAAQDAAIKALKEAIVEAVKAEDTDKLIAKYDSVVSDDDTALVGTGWDAEVYGTLADAIDQWSDEICAKEGDEITNHLNLLKSAVVGTAAKGYVDAVEAAHTEAVQAAKDALVGLVVEVEDGKSTTVKAAIDAAAEEATECKCSVAFTGDYTNKGSGSETSVEVNITVTVGNKEITEKVTVIVIVD